MKHLLLITLIISFVGCNPLESDPVTSTNFLRSDTTLSASVSTLNLFVSGTDRTITITNSGSKDANLVTYSPNPALPSGTTITPTSCGIIVAGGTCTLTISPGATASATAGNTAPTAIALSISGTNTNTISTNLNILEYGSVLGGGYLFSIDDSTAANSSVGGKVVSLNAQVIPSTGIIWGSDGSGVVSYDNVLGIYEDSATPADACNGNSDGSCNTSEIVTFYNSINTTFFAAGLCKATISSYSDWYLPSICEMGYDATTAGTGCGTSGSPTLQTIQKNLVDNGNIGSITGNYWSSTELSSDATNNAWVQNFATSGSSLQTDAIKSTLSGVRCVREI